MRYENVSGINAAGLDARIYALCHTRTVDTGDTSMV